MIVLIDNYDSFTYNVYQILARLTEEEVRVIRNDALSLEELIALNPSRLVISPGPGRPEDAGISVAAIHYFAKKIPILGICLGHQAIAYAFGSTITQARYIKHGIAETIELDGKGVYRTIGTSSVFTRYHSLVVEASTIPAEFEVSARAHDTDIMGIRHTTLPIEGVQFHPESIASQQGEALLKAFLLYRREPLSFSRMLSSLMQKESMDFETAQYFMDDLTEGLVDERHISAILTALSAKGPSAVEIAGCASVLAKKKKRIEISLPLTDIVGTGGDGKGSCNISSMAALVAAACNVPIAKHGNRAVSSLAGSADFFEALGICIDVPASKSAKMIEKTNFGFLYAPLYHNAMKHAAPVRKLLGVKTIMNLVGPLSNPAQAQHQIIGVYDRSLLVPVAQAAHMLGVMRVMVVCSVDGFDEISPCAPTEVVEIDQNGEQHSYVIDPTDLKITHTVVKDLIGGDAQENAHLAMELASGRGRETLCAAVAMNAGAAMYISSYVDTLQEGYERARKALQDGSVLKKIEEVRILSNA